MALQYNGASLVPDLNGALNLALGIGEDIKQQKNQAEAVNLSGKIGTMSSGDFMQSEDAIKSLTRLQQLDPDAARFTMGLMQAKDQAQIAQAAEEAEEAKNYYSAMYNIQDPNERRAIILERAQQLKSEGKDYSKLMEMLNMTPEQQRVRALRNMLVAGDVSGLANQGLEEQLKLQKIQMDIMNTAQQMDIREREFNLKQEGADQKSQMAAEKQAAARQKEEAVKKSAIAKAQDIAAQTELAANQMSNAWEGRAGQVAALVSPTGDAANLRRTLETIKSNVGFGELMRMKAESPTGGALGSVSEGELRLLNSTLGNLDAIQSDEELLRVLNQVRSVFSRISQDSGGPAFEPLAIGQNKPKSGGGQSGSKRIKFGDLRQ